MEEERSDLIQVVGYAKVVKNGDMCEDEKLLLTGQLEKMRRR